MMWIVGDVRDRSVRRYDDGRGRPDADRTETVVVEEDVVAIVLAGGASRRLAGSVADAGGKAALEVAGESLLGHVCRSLATVVPRIVVVAAPGQRLPVLAVPVEIVHDTTPGAGPLAGLRDGLAHALATGPRPRIALLTSCDVPLLRPALVRAILAAARDAGVGFVVPVVGGHPQVLVSALATARAGLAAELVASGRASLRGLIDAVAATGPGAVRRLDEAELAVHDPELLSFRDIDTPADLARLVAAGIPPSSP
jgi:molybdopterin-guanine dinucleotide biosynthesis protein A